MSKRPTRKPNRLQGFDYAANGAYFVTVCAANRAPLFGKIVGATALGRPPQMEFTELGKCVEKTISLANRDNIVIDQYVVMPNHIHMMIVLWSEAGDRGRSPQAANKVAQSVFLSEGFPGNASVHAGSGVCAAICAQSRRTADVPLLPSAFPESYFGGLSTVWGDRPRSPVPLYVE